MFTGIVTDIGRVVSVFPSDGWRGTGGGANGGGDLRLRIATAYDVGAIALGASIACSGACLTVVGKGGGPGAGWFEVDVSAETLSKTTLGDWTPGRAVNLERSLRVGDELGGHIVSGHVDALATIVERRAEGASARFTLETPPAFARYIAPKGSVALDGVSLTVNEVDGARFGVNLIPHSLAATTWGGAQPGTRVNLEIDVLARYVARLADAAA